MNFKHVLIVTYGRSGSTLLQGLLNSIDGCLVRGENYNVCHELFKAFKSFRNTKNKFGGESSKSATSPWYGAHLIDEDKFLRDARNLLISQLAGEEDPEDYQCIGFKEIRYLPTTLSDYAVADLHEYLNFLPRLLPDCAMIFLSRDHEQVANSAWWKAKDPAEVIERLERFEEELKIFAEGKSGMFFIDYQEVTQRDENLQNLFEFLGAPYDEERVKEVLSIKHSYTAIPEEEKENIPHDIQIHQVDPVRHMVLDKLRLQKSSDSLCMLGGVVVLDNNQEKDYHLVAVSSNGEKTAKWDIPSPKMIEKYPDCPNAGTARFRIEGVDYSANESIELKLVDDNDTSYCLANISLNEK